MAGEYDEKFDELTVLVKRVVGRVDELSLEIRDMRSEFGGLRGEFGGLRGEFGGLRGELRENTARLGSLENKVDLLSRQFNDVGSMAIKDNVRITDLESRVSVLESDVH